jgi:hypothetical protein
VNYQHYNYRLVVGFLTAITLTSCVPQTRKPVPVYPYPVRRSTTEALTILRSRSQNAPSLKANGRCRLQYYIDSKKHKENFPVKLWVNPPNEIYLQGDIAFNPKGLIAGSNEREFWLAIKPKEINSYWWGQWAGESSPQKLILSPKTMLEAIGITRIGGEENWSLSNEGVFDVLTKRNEQAAVVKKIYINRRDYLIRKIEYFDDNGKASVITELNKYKKSLDGFFVPASVKIINCIDDEEESAQITLGSIKSVNFTDKLRWHLFIRPQPQGFKHIYKIVDDRITEQLQ